jgi:hypothetical protein
VRSLTKILRRARTRLQAVVVPEIAHRGGKRGDGHSFGIITLTHRTALYDAFDGFKREQYAGLPHLFVYNEPCDRPKHANDVIYLSAGVHPAGVPMMFEKFIHCLRTCIDTPEWDACSYIIRANASTYINLPVLREHLAALPATGCYAGSIIFNGLVSGTCIIFSRDAADALVRYSAKFNVTDNDDVVIARIMRHAGIAMTDLPMKLLVGNNIPADAELAEILARYPLIRIRNDADRGRTDVALWTALAKLSVAR